jgi:NAD(P)H-dependent flavin oxidoreductase YrpB (nitropropane dioxygenase family)
LVPAVVDAVAPVPVAAAGGIADGRGLAAALALGAQGAWIGTRFLAARECRVHEDYRTRVLAAGTETPFTASSSTADGPTPLPACCALRSSRHGRRRAGRLVAVARARGR